MTVAGLPGIPGGAALVPALDMFVAGALLGCLSAEISGAPQEEVVGAFIYRHLAPDIEGETINGWTGEIDWVRLENVAEDKTRNFEIRSAELQHHVEKELESLKELCAAFGSAPAAEGPKPADLFRAGFSPLVGIGHSHPGGTKLPSAADYRLAENTATWRRAAAPQSILGKAGDAQFFEADFLFATHDLREGNGTLVHFRQGLVRGEWTGNFLPAVD